NPRSPFYVKPRLDRDMLGWGWRFWRAGTAAHVARSAPLLLALNLASRDEYVNLNDEFGGGFDFERQGLTMLTATERGLEEEAKVAAMAHELGLAAEVLDRQAVQAMEPGITLNVVGGVHFPEDAHLDPAKFMALLTQRLSGDGVEMRFSWEVTGFREEGGRIAAVEGRS